MGLNYNSEKMTLGLVTQRETRLNRVINQRRKTQASPRFAVKRRINKNRNS